MVGSGKLKRPAGPPRETSTVLVVDDDKSFLASLVDALADEEYRVVMVDSGAGAQEVLASERIDLLVTDLRMPGVDGFALMRDVLNKKGFTPCIVTTAFATTELKERVEALGVFDVIGKPIDVSDLRDKIREALKRGGEGGVVRGLALASFLQLLALERKTCTVKISGSSRSGLLFFKTGELIDASTDERSGVDAAFEIFSWEDVEITLRSGCRRRQRAIKQTLEALLLEAFRRRDEETAGRPGSGAAQDRTTTGSVEREEAKMAAMDSFLEEFKGINGYLASGIMDFTGEVLTAHSASDKVDLAATGAVFNDIFRSAHEASKKIGLEACRVMTITTPKGVVIMECSGTNAKVHLHCISVLDVGGNQALAKLTMEKLVPKVVAALG